jgi:hypothetical protein
MATKEPKGASDQRRVPVRVIQAAEPAPGISPSYRERLTLAFFECRTRRSSWHDESLVRERLS